MDIKHFLSDPEENEAFITGPAGSGKTTALIEVVKQLNDMGVKYRVVAYTHKAKDVLISKLPADTDISTLHSWLKKRPGINEKAKSLKALVTTMQFGQPVYIQLLIVDEFSFVGEKDYFSIGKLQDQLELNYWEHPNNHCENAGTTLPANPYRSPVDIPDDEVVPICEHCGKPYQRVCIPPIKVLYVGDLNQLSPVDGPSAVYPHEPYWRKLTTVHRTHNTLTQPLALLVDMMEGRRKQAYLEPTPDFIRKVDIVELYKQDKDTDKIMLAYTNQRVQEINALIQGRAEPQPGDKLYDSSLKQFIEIEGIHDTWKWECKTVNGVINPDTKFNPLRLLNNLDFVKFYQISEYVAIPAIFGMFENKKIREDIGRELVEKNKAGLDSKAQYRLYKTISDYVSILDFAHCVTIHKSQGSEYNHVYVDSQDLSRCFDQSERMRLLYVSISRAREKCYLSN